jgi:predicted DNA-binding transcriptional regulator AlpA
MAEAKSLTFLSKKQVLARVPLSYPSLWKRMRLGSFPRPRVLGGKNAWLESEVDAFLAGLPPREYSGNPKSVVEGKFTDKRLPKRVRR